ncbi:alpha-1,4-glucan--maltose-1-phosphate maltosyltransferase [Actinocorallia longicatena]|uniref:starch synthase (maltosyl-transferring) n=2 Tax=Actinocorallia longicatena TaxID=111803 RepID=A0ABP6Q2U3_9ACTN
MLGAGVTLRSPDGTQRPWIRLTEKQPGTDRLTAEIDVGEETGTWHFRIEAWGDPIAHWLHDAEIKVPRNQDLDLVVLEGARLFARAAKGTPKALRAPVKQLAEAFKEGALPASLLLGKVHELRDVLEAHPVRELLTRTAWFPLKVHRRQARFSSWYEFFPRSEGAVFDPMGRRPPQSGTFQTAMKRLPAVAAMGFDVLYLPPIHPIGLQYRKGPNNTLNAGPDDPGSPWAIGSPDGGHDAIHPDLGTIDDFDAFVERANGLGLEIALDLALQCSPDHPWVKEHPEWFTTRADGTIAYAENPPKKYQDIYPVNFDNDPEGIYQAVLEIVRYWMDHGVRVFRVDNPHTKPVRFWERLLKEIDRTDPDVLFLAEAFTRPAMMHTLGKIGFHQSYTYFTWRNSKDELQEYGEQLKAAAHYMRPNFFVNTPDILHAYLQHGGRPAFQIRAVLAALMSPAWGVYAGFELCEHLPVRPGSEEYRDSEKYQLKDRDWTAEDSLAPLLTTLNELRRDHPALQRLGTLTFHPTDDPEVIAFSKGDVLAVVNLNPHHPRETMVHLDWPDPQQVTDVLSGATYTWHEHNYVRLDPHHQPAHVFTIEGGSAA